MTRTNSPTMAGIMLPSHEEASTMLLKHVREPTEAMLVAARDWSYAKYGNPIGNDAARGCWQAMLDAAVFDDNH